MTDNIVQFPERSVSIVGPKRGGHVVIVEGRSIPHLHCHPLADGSIELILDGRFGITVAAADAHQVAWFVATALAIGEGYPFIGATTKERPFAPEIRRMDHPTPTEGDSQ